ncbi:MAG TPA: hypothetical protein VK866_13360, partial [Acidimicrobiales bacterium]|nr:hypothetical protein [Acidimicrobiales bacterium]
MSKSQPMLRSGPWVLRLSWLLLPVTLGLSLGDALDGRSDPVVWLTAVAGWLLWTLGLVATLVPRVEALTPLRVVAPAFVPLSLWAAATVDDVGAVQVLGVLGATVVAVVVLSPQTGDVFVNGSAYGHERRFALRAPAPLLFGPVVLVWALVVAGAVAGPLLLAAEQWVLGGIALVVGWAAAALGGRALHQLSRRWLVFVPAGVVVHDPMGFQPQLLPRANVARFGPAPADTDATDLTNRASGLALEIELIDPATLEQRQRGRRGELVEVQRVLVTPTRPGAVLVEAQERRL